MKKVCLLFYTNMNFRQLTTNPQQLVHTWSQPIHIKTKEHNYRFQTVCFVSPSCLLRVCFVFPS